MGKNRKLLQVSRDFLGHSPRSRAHVVSVETDITKGLHAFTIVGLPDKSVEEAKDRIASAIKNSEFESPKRSNKKIVISLAPATLKKRAGLLICRWRFRLCLLRSRLNLILRESCSPEN